MRFWRRSAIRTRLTVLYAGAFFAAGAVLVALMYFYLQQSLEHTPTGNALGAARNFLGEQGARNHPLFDSVVHALTAQAEQQRHDTLRSMLIWSLASLAMIGIVAGGCGWLLAGGVLRPLQEVTATARRVADRNLHERISLDGPDDEIKELADTFDDMLERLDRAFDGQHRFVANASHELRTPLAINRTLLEVALEDPAVPEETRRLGQTLLAVNRRHERLIDGLLLLAHSDQPIDRHIRVDLATVARRAITNLDRDLSHIRTTSELQHVMVIGDPVLLERLVANLVENAILYNVAVEAWIQLTVAADAKSARLTVANSGPVISPDDVEGLFEPFHRLTVDEHLVQSDPSVKSGAGLGLSIVRSIAVAHGGHVSAIAQAKGGLTVEVVLPAAQ